MLYCFVNNTGSLSNHIIWTTPSEANLVIFPSTNTPQMSPNGVFSAERVSTSSNTINSSLTFTAESSLDEGVVLCRGNQHPMAIEDNCTLLVYSKGILYSIIIYAPVIAVPSNVTGLTVTSITYQSVSLLWSPSTDTGGYSTVNYIITVTSLNRNSSQSISTDATNYTATGLISGLSYNFTVMANNSIGEGETNDIANVIILEG